VQNYAWIGIEAMWWELICQFDLKVIVLCNLWIGCRISKIIHILTRVCLFAINALWTTLMRFKNNIISLNSWMLQLILIANLHNVLNEWINFILVSWLDEKSQKLFNFWNKLNSILHKINNKEILWEFEDFFAPLFRSIFCVKFFTVI
jgi:hypothetical protein